jgi:hypothetical protein
MVFTYHAYPGSTRVQMKSYRVPRRYTSSVGGVTRCVVNTPTGEDSTMNKHGQQHGCGSGTAKKQTRLRWTHPNGSVSNVVSPAWVCCVGGTPRYDYSPAVTAHLWYFSISEMMQSSSLPVVGHSQLLLGRGTSKP